MIRRSLSASLLCALAALLLAGCTTSDTPAPAAPVAPASPLGSPAPTPSAPVQSAPLANPVTSPATPVAPVTAAPVTPPPVQAPAVVDLKPSTITGSEETSTMFDNFTAYIHAIDGQTVFGGRSSWDIPLPLKPGQRQLTIAFIRGVFTAQTQVQLRVRPDAVYRLKFESDAHIFGKNSYCEFWIEDTATGWKVVPPTRVPLAKTEQAK